MGKAREVQVCCWVEQVGSFLCTTSVQKTKRVFKGINSTTPSINFTNYHLTATAQYAISVKWIMSLLVVYVSYRTILMQSNGLLFLYDLYNLSLIISQVILPLVANKQSNKYVWKHKVTYLTHSVHIVQIIILIELLTTDDNCSEMPLISMVILITCILKMLFYSLPYIHAILINFVL